MKVKVKLLLKYMEQNNLSALELARKMGISLIEIQKILNGDAVGVETTRRFIRYFTADKAQELIDWEAIGKKNPLAESDAADRGENNDN